MVTTVIPTTKSLTSQIVEVQIDFDGYKFGKNSYIPTESSINIYIFGILYLEDSSYAVKDYFGGNTNPFVQRSFLR